MSHRYVRDAFVVAVVLFPATAQTEPAQRSGDRERELAQIIRQAGYDCSLVASIDVIPDPPPGWESLRPEVALCVNGKRYLVAKSGRSGGNVRPVVRPMF